MTSTEYGRVHQEPTIPPPNREFEPVIDETEDRKSREPSRAEVRNQLAARLPRDALLHAFCCDHFPNVYANFSDGMDRISKVTMLLEAYPASEILNRLNDYCNVNQTQRKDLSAENKKSTGWISKWKYVILGIWIYDYLVCKWRSLMQNRVIRLLLTAIFGVAAAGVFFSPEHPSLRGYPASKNRYPLPGLENQGLPMLSPATSVDTEDRRKTPTPPSHSEEPAQSEPVEKYSDTNVKQKSIEKLSFVPKTLVVVERQLSDGCNPYFVYYCKKNLRSECKIGPNECRPPKVMKSAWPEEIYIHWVGRRGRKIKPVSRGNISRLGDKITVTDTFDGCSIKLTLYGGR